MNNLIELSNIEIYEHCMLNIKTGEKDIDLFYQIKQSYKNEEYYKKFTK